MVLTVCGPIFTCCVAKAAGTLAYTKCFNVYILETILYEIQNTINLQVTTLNMRHFYLQPLWLVTLVVADI